MQLAKKEAREEKERLANDPDAQAMGRWKMELGKKQAKDLKAQAAMRDINEVRKRSTMKRSGLFRLLATGRVYCTIPTGIYVRN